MKNFIVSMICLFLISACIHDPYYGYQQVYPNYPSYGHQQSYPNYPSYGHQQSYPNYPSYGHQQSYPNVVAQLPTVVMYSTKTCSYCQQARAYFASRGIRYTEYDVNETEEGRRFNRNNNYGVPIIFICGQRMEGWSNGVFESFYARC